MESSIQTHVNTFPPEHLYIWAQGPVEWLISSYQLTLHGCVQLIRPVTISKRGTCDV